MSNQNLTNEELKKEIDSRVLKIKDWFVRENFSAEQILNFAAIIFAQSSILEEEQQEHIEELERHAQQLVSFSSVFDQSRDMAHAYIKLLEQTPSKLVDALVKGVLIGKSIAPKRNAKKRHAEHHSMKAEVFVWCDANMLNYKSMDKAAEAIAGKITPIAFRTARAWIGEWKKLRSPGTA